MAFYIGFHAYAIIVHEQVYQILPQLLSVAMMRSRKIGTERLKSKNHLDSSKRADFSSSVNSLGTYQA